METVNGKNKQQLKESIYTIQEIIVNYHGNQLNEIKAYKKIIDEVKQ